MQEINTFTEKTSKWLTEEAFNDTLFRENFCINLLWIFSQPRIHPKNKKIHQICTNCFNKLSGQSAKILGFSFIQDAITEAEHTLTKILGKLPESIQKRSEPLYPLHTASCVSKTSPNPRTLTPGLSGS